jgi:hypothetical protein
MLPEWQSATLVRVMSDSADVALFAELMLAKTSPTAQTADIRTPLRNRVKVQRRCMLHTARPGFCRFIRKLLNTAMGGRGARWSLRFCVCTALARAADPSRALAGARRCMPQALCRPRLSPGTSRCKHAPTPARPTPAASPFYSGGSGQLLRWLSLTLALPLLYDTRRLRSPLVPHCRWLFAPKTDMLLRECDSGFATA